MDNQQIQIQIPAGAARIIRRLEKEGYEAFIVGGCVRDACLGRKANDWDITTNAAPLTVKSLFRRTIDTGIQHGTVTVMDGDEGYEVTTYRIDGLYEDGRHPKEVTFTSDLTEDLRRRDFTINAMAYSERTGLVDVFGGISDLQAGYIRCVGEAKERFSEDALRILRAVRFASQLNFTIDPGTAQAAAELAPTLEKISAERIHDELQKILISDHPERLKEAYELGITAVVLPEFDRIMQQSLSRGCANVGEHTLLAMQQIRPERVLRWTMLVHDFGKPFCSVTGEDGRLHFPEHAQKSAELADTVLNRLKSDRQTQRQVHALAACHTDKPEAEAVQVRRMASRVGSDTFALYLEVKRADILAGTPELKEERLTWLEETERIWQEILERQDPLTVKDLAVTGRDLIREGIQPGRQMGALLETLLDAVLEDPACNVRETLLGMALRENSV